MFVFISGTKVRRESLFRYDDYCPIHRKLHSFDLVQVRTTRHLYGLSTGRWRNEGCIGVDEGPCRVVRPVDRAQIESQPAEVRWGPRLEVERVLRTDPNSVPMERRVALFHESVQALIDARLPPDSVGNRSAARVFFPALGCLVLMVALIIAGLPGSVMKFPMYLAVLTMVVGPFVAKALADDRYRSEVANLVPGALQPLALEADTLRKEFKRAGRQARPVERALSQSHAMNGPAPTQDAGMMQQF